MIVIVFIIASLFTLAAGVVLEETSNQIAMHMGWSGVVFAATALAFTTSLPDFSTGLASIKVNDYTMAVSDIMGGQRLSSRPLLPGKPAFRQSCPATRQQHGYLPFRSGDFTRLRLPLRADLSSSHLQNHRPRLADSVVSLYHRHRGTLLRRQGG